MIVEYFLGSLVTLVSIIMFNKFTNKNYETIQNNKELREFYNYFKSKIKEISDKLPISNDLNGEFIPNIVEKSMLDILKSDKSIMDKLGESVKHVLDINDFSKESSFILDETLIKDAVPLKYLGSLPENIKSKDLKAFKLLKYRFFLFMWPLFIRNINFFAWNC
jgi:hypothetical protein